MCLFTLLFLQNRLRDDHPKIYGYATHVIPHYLPADFIAMFRMKPSTFEVVLNLLGGVTIPPVEGRPGRPPVPLSEQLLMTLMFLGSQQKTRDIADRFGHTDSCMFRCRNAIIDVITNKLMSQVWAVISSISYIAIALCNILWRICTFSYLLFGITHGIAAVLSCWLVLILCVHQ